MDLVPPCVWHFLKERFTLQEPLVSVQEAKSAQQTVLVLRLPPRSVRSNTDADNDAWAPALVRGRDRLVLRIWRGSARWWNLQSSHHREEDRNAMARQELDGYRLARHALRNQNDVARRPYIPQILYQAIENQPDGPWAILEYVGKDSFLFDDDMCDETWFHCMVKVRHEFGFDEPHPRWGRVPTDQSLGYALDVLEQVVIPLHRYLHEEPAHKAVLAADFSTNATSPTTVYTFQSMLNMYKTALESIQGSQCTDPKIKEALEVLQKGLLRMDTDSRTVQNLPSVLVHMDLQPQNILFAKQSGSNEDSQRIVSVLDWEESAIADPRFELLMLGRKVCADRQQASAVWDTYSKKMHVPLGSIDPWLHMETLHSLIILILQLLDLSDGRSPWESKTCLMKKIEREIERLSSMSA